MMADSPLELESGLRRIAYYVRRQTIRPMKTLMKTGEKIPLIEIPYTRSYTQQG